MLWRRWLIKCNYSGGMILIRVTVGESCSGALVGMFSNILLFLMSLMGKDTVMSFGWPPGLRRSNGYRLIWRCLTPSYSLIFWGVPQICSMSKVSSAHSGSGEEVPVLSGEQDLGENVSFPFLHKARSLLDEPCHGLGTPGSRVREGV